MSVTQREKEFYDDHWKEYNSEFIVNEEMEVPEIQDFSKKKILVCGSGDGVYPVAFAKKNAEVYTFDISESAVEITKKLADYNKIKLQAQTMDLQKMTYQNGFFDIIYGNAILHHVDCKAAAQEIFRCLKPGGIAYFRENSDNNPILRFLRRSLFGKPGSKQKTSFLFFKRTGSSDEYPLTQEEVNEFKKVFADKVKIYYPEFYFFQIFSFIGLKKPLIVRLCKWLDLILGKIFPPLLKYSFHQNIWMQK